MSKSAWIFLALGGFVANLLGTAVHELGHGFAALALGGEFHDIFVSPLGGQSGALAPGFGNAVVLAAGSVAELALGGIAWWVCRVRLAAAGGHRRADPATILCWLVAAQAVLDSLVYICFAPAVQSMFGAVAGDWPLLLQSQPELRSALFAFGLLVTVPVSSRLVASAPLVLPETDAATLDTSRDRPPFPVIAVRAWVFMLLPSVVLRCVWAIAFMAWLDTPIAIAIGSISDVLLFGIPGGLWVWWQHRRGDPQTPSPAAVGPPRTSDRLFTPASLLLAAVVIGTVFLFGPVDALRRGVLVGKPSGDQYIGAAQELRLAIDPCRDGHLVLSITSRPLPETGSHYRRQLTAALATDGPSLSAARELAEFIARWNLGNAAVAGVSTPQRAGSAWRWDAELVSAGPPLDIALWPVTWVRESKIAELSVAHARLAGAQGADAMTARGDSTAFTWHRPEAMDEVVRFRVDWSCNSG